MKKLLILISAVVVTGHAIDANQTGFKIRFGTNTLPPPEPAPTNSSVRIGLTNPAVTNENTIRIGNEALSPRLWKHPWPIVIRYANGIKPKFSTNEWNELVIDLTK